MNKEEYTNCPQCPNHCPKDNLMCERGRTFFEGKNECVENKHHSKPVEEMNEDELLTYYLRKCGHILHHNQEFANSNKLFNSFSHEEKHTLISLLNKLLTDWENK